MTSSGAPPGAPVPSLAGVGTFADDDGVIRSYEYWTCINREGDGGGSFWPGNAPYRTCMHGTAR